MTGDTAVPLRTACPGIRGGGEGTDLWCTSDCPIYDARRQCFTGRKPLRHSICMRATVQTRRIYWTQARPGPVALSRLFRGKAHSEPLVTASFSTASSWSALVFHARPHQRAGGEVIAVAVAVGEEIGAGQPLGAPPADVCRTPIDEGLTTTRLGAGDGCRNPYHHDSQPRRGLGRHHGTRRDHFGANYQARYSAHSNGPAARSGARAGGHASTPTSPACHGTVNGL
jgi:hypothetical protein